MKKYVALVLVLVLMAAAVSIDRIIQDPITEDLNEETQLSSSSFTANCSSYASHLPSDASSAFTSSASQAISVEGASSIESSGGAVFTPSYPAFTPSVSGTAAGESSAGQQSSNSLSSQTPSSPQSSSSQLVSEVPENPAAESEMRAVWISYLELNFTGMNAEQSKSKITSMFTELKDMGFNTIIAHVRPYADAYYKSDYFPYTKYLTGTQGTDPGWDPLEHMIEQAHAMGMQLHAWINPYRISTSSDDPMQLAENHPARIWLTDSDVSNNDWAVKCKGGIYFNPAIPEVRRLIIDSVKEIVRNYKIDGIHFDDYFYPTTEASFDSAAYTRYTSSGGLLNVSDWRRVQVNTLISGVYQAVKGINSSVDFGISPSGNLSYCTDTLYADAALWMSRTGYIDYICPQLYWGFEYPNTQFCFNNIADKWASMSAHKNLKLYFGLAVYKSGQVDAGSTEWIVKNDIIKRQIEYSRSKANCHGIALFSYGSVTGSDTCFMQERNNYLPLLKN